MTIGAITTEKTVWCGICSEWDQKPLRDGMRALHRIWRGLGWRRTHKRGWLCPSCVKDPEGELARQLSFDEESP